MSHAVKTIRPRFMLIPTSFKAPVVTPLFSATRQIILHSMHRYYPRFHVTQADSPYTVRWGPFQSFSFPEMTFTAVTAYQNPKVQMCRLRLRTTDPAQTL